jgi:hypothetical protein
MAGVHTISQVIVKIYLSHAPPSIQWGKELPPSRMSRNRLLMYMVLITLGCQAVALVAYELYGHMIFKPMAYVALGLVLIFWVRARFGGPQAE